MKKRGKVFFHPIDGTGTLTISWSSLPKGDAVEAVKGSGVGFFSEKGALLSVIFDEVQSDVDHQVLEFPHHVVKVTVANGEAAHAMTCTKPSPKRKKPSRAIPKKRKKNSTRS